jgi:hypothetical protein
MLYLPLEKILQMGNGTLPVVDGTPAGGVAPSGVQGVPPVNALSNDARSRDAARIRERDSR